MSAALTLRQRGLSPAAIISKLSLVSLQHVVLFCLLPFCSKVPSYNLLSPLIFQTSSRCVSRHLEFFIYHLHLRSHLSCYFFDAQYYTASVCASLRSFSVSFRLPAQPNGREESHRLPRLSAMVQEMI